MKSNFLKLSLLICLILVTVFFERIVPNYPEWKYITFAPAVMLFFNLVYRGKKINRLIPFYLFLGVVLYVALANITAPGVIVSMLVPTLTGGVIALLISYFFGKKQVQNSNTD